MVNAQSPAAVVAGNVETSQRDRRHRARGARPGGRAARPGPGDDEQPRHRRPGLDLLRDDRRRPGRERRAARARPACTSACPTRSTRRSRRSSRVPDAGRALRAARRLGRRRRASRRRRRRARGARARAGHAVAAHRPPSPRAGGAAGGGHGRPASTAWATRCWPRRRALELAEGEVVEVRTPGGGGWGRPASSGKVGRRGAAPHDTRRRRLPGRSTARARRGDGAGA